MKLGGKVIPVARVVVIAAALIASACTGGGSAAIDVPVETPTQAPNDAVATTEPAAQPDPTAMVEVVSLSDEERLAAAVAVFEANPQPEGMLAYDLIDTSFSVGKARIAICGWNGDTVFDQVRLITYRVSETPGADGQPTVDFESASVVTTEECLNSTLAESALQATRDYDNYWRGVVEDPGSFEEDELRAFMVRAAIEPVSERVQQWSSGGLAFRSTEYDGRLPDSSLTEVVGRQWDQDGVESLELLFCRTLKADYGMYQGNVLIDDFKGDSPSGQEVISRYRLVRNQEEWKLFAVESFVWSDCVSKQEMWLQAINGAFPDPAEWYLWGG